MMKHFFMGLAMALALLFPATLLAQKFTLSGYVRDKQTGEELIGANIYFSELLKGTVSNTYGFYSISTEKGSYTLVISYLGYETYETRVELINDIRLNIELQPSGLSTGEVTIQADRTDKNVKSTETGTILLPIKTIESLPVLFGEVDILKTIQLLPGVQSAGEGSAGFYVRGGGPDQNLILLDGATVYNASHLFGFFSVFNSDAIKDVKLIKGGMPAEYGGRLSSVLDISMKEGNMKEYKARGGISLIASRLTVEGPIKEDTSSFIISGRRTYVDLLIRPFVPDSSPFAGSGYYFYDLNAKVNYRISDRDRVFLSGYFGRDVFSFANAENGVAMNIPWGNTTASARWNHLFSDKLFMNTTAIYSDYQFSIDILQNDFNLKLFSGITNYTLKTDFSYFPGDNHKITFGANYTRHLFIPSSVSGQSEEVSIDVGDALLQFANDYSIYINDEFDLTPRLRINAGLRGTIFQQVGPFTRYVKNTEGVNTDTITWNAGDEVVRFQNLEPRLSMRYTLGKSNSLKASYTHNYQYIHLASVSTVLLPTDLWIPSSDVVFPQVGNQYSIGYFHNFFEDYLETSVELYYKTMENQIEYRPGSSFGLTVGDNADNNFVYGDGESYGMELFVRKNFGSITGFAGYTLSRTTRQFDDINLGNPYPARYDRRHDFSGTLTYEYDKWQFSAVFVYGTGSAFTPIVGRYFMDNGTIVTEYGDFNSFRMPHYHRMDVSITYLLMQKDERRSSLNLSVYNVYNRQNPYFIYYDFQGSILDGQFATMAKQVTIFPIMPSIAWNFSF